MPAWLSYLLIAVVVAVLTALLAGLIPSPGNTVAMVIGYLVAAVFAVYGLVALIRGGPRL